MSRFTPFLRILVPVASLLMSVPVSADDLPAYLKDRGDGIPTSMFGTYVKTHQLLMCRQLHDIQGHIEFRERGNAIINTLDRVEMMENCRGAPMANVSFNM